MSISDGKELLLSKQEPGVLAERYRQVQDILRPEVVKTITAGQLMVPSIGVIWEPPLICEWIVEPLRPYLCGPEAGQPGYFKLEPCRYGESKWGWCFWDPAFTTIHAIKLMQKALVTPALEAALGRVLASAGVADVLSIKTVFNYRAVKAVAEQKFSRDPGMIRSFQDLYRGLDTVEWEGLRLHRIHIEGVGEVWFDTLSNLLLGYITGITPTGFGVLLDYNEEVFDAYLWRWINGKVVDSIIRFLPGYASTKAGKRSPIGYGQELTFEAEKWGEKRALAEHVRQKVLRKLEQMGVGPVESQAYVSAAWELLFYFHGPKGEMPDYVRKWGYDLDFESYVKVWRGKWEALGLKPEVLEEIAGMVAGIWERHHRLSLLERAASKLLRPQ